MAQGSFALDSQRAHETATLYSNLREELGSKFTFERFLGWVGQYLRASREFHGIDHLLAMSKLEDPVLGFGLPSNSKVYSMVAGFFHDEDYPSISEELTPISKRYVEKYVDIQGGKKFVRELDPNDKTGKILYSIFGFKPGQELSAFPIFAEGKLTNPGGMNEFYCAAAAASELAELGKDAKFIAAVVTGIEATIPFRNPNRMNELKARLSTTNTELKLGLTDAEMDEIMIGAVYTANKDVISFLGGLDPQIHDSATTLSVINTIKGGDMLSPEEIPSLRMKDQPLNKSAGEYPPADFLAARIKRAGLYQLVIPGKTAEGTIPNLFFNVSLSDGSKFPANGWTEKANKLAFANNKPVRVAEYARLISAGVIHCVSALGNEATDPTKIMLKDLVTGMAERLSIPGLPVDATQERKLAFACLDGRHATSGHDIRRSPLAELVLSRLDENQVEELGQKSRGVLFPKCNPQAFLELATEYLGNIVGQIRDEMAHSASAANKHTIAAGLRSVTMPPVKAPGN